MWKHSREDHVQSATTNCRVKRGSVKTKSVKSSVLGPIMWNLMYNDVLTLNIPEEANIIVFANDIAVTESAMFIDEIELLANNVI